VKCDFLPDRDREILERTEREKLKAVFLADQEKVKQVSPKPQISNPQYWTLNPKPWTLNLKLEIRNPKP